MRGNPFYGLTIGATINPKGKLYGPSVIEGNISLMNPQSESTESMTGQSSHVYTDSLNQGSLGISGSYGVSGISKVKASLSGYVGKAAAKSDKAITVNYNVLVTAGLEYISFNRLRVSDLLAALEEGTRRRALECLDAYLALEAELKTLKVGLFEVVKHQDNPSYEKANVLFDSWTESMEEFNEADGDGLIVGVMWGGFGTVTMKMKAASTNSTLKYGGAADFSYSGIGTSVSVAATYDGGQSHGQGEVEVNCSKSSSGACVAELVGNWFKEVSGKSFADLAAVEVLQKLPSLSEAKGAPVIPAFVEPRPKKSITEKIGDIKDLDGLRALAKASAYEDAKKTNESLTLDQFLSDADKKADTKPLTELEEKIDNNNLSVLSGSSKAEQEKFPSDLPDALEEGDGLPKKASPEGYVPLGIWIAGWGDIFPWLAAGYCNNLDDMAGVDEMLKYRMMIQDFQTLYRLYYMAEQFKLVLFPANVAGQIANSFANRCALLQQKGPGGMIEAFEGLADAAKKIYRKWDEIKFLRDCELGLGVILDGNESIKNEPPGVAEGTAVSYYYSAPCVFTEGSDNHSAFATFLKVFPIIGPTDEIFAFGPSEACLGRVSSPSSAPPRLFFFGNEKAGASGNSVLGIAIPLEVNQTKKILESKEYHCKFYPIPFAAAEGIEWQGESLSTNLSSMRGLKDQLNEVHKELSGLKAWTFSSEAWKHWTPERCYALSNIETQYMGLIPEKGNIF